MTLEELNTVLAGTELPVAYLAFPAPVNGINLKSMQIKKV